MTDYLPDLILGLAVILPVFWRRTRKPAPIVYPPASAHRGKSINWAWFSLVRVR